MLIIISESAYRGKFFKKKCIYRHFRFRPIFDKENIYAISVN